METWTDMGLIWSIDRDGTWEKQADAEGRRPLWAPEIRYIASKNTWYIAYSMGTFAPIGLRGGLLRSTSGLPQGPYVRRSPKMRWSTTLTYPYLKIPTAVCTCSRGNLNIAKMNADLTGFIEPFRRLTSQSGQDIGFEGSGMIKANGKYYLFAAKVNTDYGTYSTPTT